MKKELSVLIFLIIMFPCFSGGSLEIPCDADFSESTSWKTSYYVNSYGENTEPTVYTTRTGTFTNSATNGSSMNVKLVVSNSESVAIFINEYGRYKALSIGNEGYTMRITSNGEEVAKGHVVHSDDRFLFPLRWIFQELCEGKTLRFYMSGGDYVTSTYTFSISGKGFAQTATNIFPIGSKNSSQQFSKGNMKRFSITVGHALNYDKWLLTFNYFPFVSNIGYYVGFAGYNNFTGKNDNDCNGWMSSDKDIFLDFDPDPSDSISKYSYKTKFVEDKERISSIASSFGLSYRVVDHLYIKSGLELVINTGKGYHHGSIYYIPESASNYVLYSDDCWLYSYDTKVFGVALQAGVNVPINPIDLDVMLNYSFLNKAFTIDFSVGVLF